MRRGSLVQLALFGVIAAAAGATLALVPAWLPEPATREALSALERLYTQTERWDDLMALYERQIAIEGAPAEKKAKLHHSLRSTGTPASRSRGRRSRRCS